MSNVNDVFSALSTLGFENNGAYCYGTWKGYAVSLHQFAAKIYYVYVAVQQEKYPLSLQKALRRAVKEKGRPMEGAERFLKRTVVFSASFSKTDDIAGRFAERMDVITAALRDNGVAPADTCAVSGSSHPDSLCLIASGGAVSYQPVCAAAVRNQNDQTREQVEDNEVSGNYALGIIGALLGMLVGLVPNLLTIIFVERIYGILFALVPVAAMFGYKLFKGRMSRASVVIVIVLSLLGVVLIPYAELAFYLIRDYHLPFGEGLSVAFQLMADPGNWADLRGEFLQLLLFMALGIFVSFRFLRGKTNSSIVANSDAMLDSLRPNPNGPYFDAVDSE